MMINKICKLIVVFNGVAFRSVRREYILYCLLFIVSV
jgi:hypothetical protein